MKNLKFAMLIVFCQFLSFSANAQFPSINITTNTNPSNGFTFIASYSMSTAGIYYLLILDKLGRIIYAKSFPTSMNGGFLDFKRQPNNKYSFFSSKQSCYYIMDQFFNIIDTVSAKNGYSTNGHELVMSNNNRYFIIADELRTMDLSTIVSGGKTNAQVRGNIIQEIDANNNLIFEWKILDQIPITDHVGDLTSPAFDFAHTNSLFLDTDTSILMCNPALNEITKINLNNGNIIWRFGLLAKSNQFTFSNDTLGFIFQHYVNRLPNGNITLFDNGLGRYARAVEYEINEVNKTANLVFQYRSTPDVTGPSMGSVNRLANGNTFIGWGSACKMTEVDTAGNKVFEALFPNCTYRALKYNIPSPISNLISGPSEVCQGQTVTYTANPCANCTYSWNITNGTIISGQGTNTLTVRWPNNGQGTVRLTKINSLNYKDYFFIYVTVLPGPTADMGIVQFCKGARFIDYTNNSVTRLWDFGDGDTSTLSDINHIYKSAGTYLVMLKVINNYGCIDSSTQTIIIPDSIKADFSIDSNVCINEKNPVINYSINADSFFWHLGDSLISNLKNPLAFAFPSDGPCDVKLVVTGSGCKDSITKTVIVNPNPQARLTLSEICNGAGFIDSSINSVFRIWDFGDGDTSSLPDLDHIYRSPGTYQVKLKVMNNYGCTDTITQKVIIPEKPKAVFSMDTNVCVSEISPIINNSTDANGYFWYSGNSMFSTLKNPLAFSFPADGSYDIKLVVKGSGCADSLTKTVVVHPNPQAHMSFSEICNGAGFTDSSINSVFCIWDFGDGDTSTFPAVDHIYRFPGTYQVRMKVISDQGCADSIMGSVIIPDALKADFSIDTIVCCYELITVINNSTDADIFNWYSGDSLFSNFKNPLTFSFPADGSYDIKLVVKGSGCADSLTKTVVVLPNPQAHMSFSEICNGAGFTDSSVNSVFRIWDFGDGDTSTFPAVDHIYRFPGTYQVKMKAFNSIGCTDSTVESVTIHQAPKADFDIDSIVCASGPISIINNSTDAIKYFWDLGDSRTSILMTPETFHYNSAGSYQVKLVAYSSVCSDSLIQTVFVMPNPEVNFGSTKLTDSSIQFNDSSVISAGSIVFWDWNFGDGSTSTFQNPMHVYSSPGTYIVELCTTSNEGCKACDNKSIVVKSSGIDMSETDHFIYIFPNPNNGNFSIKSSKTLDLIVIANAFGQEVMVLKPKTDTEFIDLSDKPKGIYIAKLRLENSDQVVRIIVN